MGKPLAKTTPDTPPDSGSRAMCVLAEPAPLVALSAFGADGLEFTVSYWFDDPENGQLNLKSDINRAILKTLQAHGIAIPFPQRVVHTSSKT